MFLIELSFAHVTHQMLAFWYDVAAFSILLGAQSINISDAVNTVSFITLLQVSESFIRIGWHFFGVGVRGRHGAIVAEESQT